MGIMGRYIDALPERAKDRIVRGQGWKPRTLHDGEGAGCLRGHSEGYVSELRAVYAPTPDVEAQEVFLCFLHRMHGGHMSRPQRNPASQFNRACDRFGTDRVVRAIKLRAGAKVEDLEPVSTAPTSSAGAHG